MDFVAKIVAVVEVVWVGKAVGKVVVAAIELGIKL